MKTYEFKIEIPELTNGSSFIKQLQAEISDERKQLALTTAINTETTKVHKQILQDLVDTINKELDEVGLGFDEVFNYGKSNNGYRNSKAIIEISSVSYELSIIGQPEHGFKDSKYVTYTGKYLIGVRREDCIEPSFIKHDENILNNIFEYFKRDLKKHMEYLVM